MSMIRLQNQTPSEYSEQSRDFQLLCRLYDTVFNGIQYDVSTIQSILDTKMCRDILLPLLQTKIGFFTNIEVNNVSLRYYLEVFPLLVKSKGTADAIRKAVITFLKINNIKSPVIINYTKEEMQLYSNYTVPDHTIIISINSSLQDTSLLEEVFRYILPAGIGYYFYFYNTIDAAETLATSDKAVLIYSSYNINAQIRGTTSIMGGEEPGVYDDEEINRLMNAVDTIILESSDSIIPVKPTVYTLEDSLVTIPNGKENTDIQEIVCNDIEGYQEGENEPSPSNKRDIHGINEFNITRIGKNLLNMEEVEQGGIDETTGEETQSSSTKRSGWIKVNELSDYIASGFAGTLRWFFYDKNKQYISQAGTSYSVTTAENANWIRVHAANNSWNNGSNHQIEVGNTATEYEPYAVDTYTATNDPENDILSVDMLHSGAGNLIESVVYGKTEKRNQLIKNGNFNTSTQDWSKNVASSLTVEDGVADLLCAAENTDNRIYQQITRGLISGHSYFIRVDLRKDTENVVQAKIQMKNDNSVFSGSDDITLSNEWNTYTSIFNSEYDTAYLIIGSIAPYLEPVDIFIRNVNVIDLNNIFSDDEIAVITDYDTLKEAWFHRFGSDIPYYLDYTPGEVVCNDSVYKNTTSEKIDCSQIKLNGISTSQGTYLDKFVAETGGITRNCERVDLGSLTWNERSEGDLKYFYATPSVLGKSDDNYSILCGEYNTDIVDLVTNTIENVPVASFTDGADGIPVKRMTVNITPVQAAGTPTPENPLPISGWTGANVFDTANPNLYDKDIATLYQRIINISGVSRTEWYPSSAGRTFAIPCEPNTKYTVIDTSNLMATLNVGAFTGSELPSVDDQNVFYLINAAAAPNVQPLAVSITTPADATYLIVQIGRTAADAKTNKTYVMQGEPENIEVSWQSEAGTVYGGTLTDNGDGTWKVQPTMAIVDLGSFSWNKSSGVSGGFYSSGLTDYKFANNATFLCAAYKADGYGNADDGYYGANNTIRYLWVSASVGSREIYIHDDAQAQATTEEFRSAVTGVKLCYELANLPAPIVLTAESIRTLLGQNNIFADCGNINELTYYVNSYNDNSISCSSINNNYEIRIRDNSYSSVSDFATAMNGIYAVYARLNTSTSYSTIQQISNQYGINKLSPISGDVENALVEITYPSIYKNINNNIIIADNQEVYKANLEINQDIQTRTLSGSLVSFSDAVPDVSLKELEVPINPIQDLHGYEYPWPAGGGKNKLDPSNVVAAYIYVSEGESYGSFIESSGNSRSVYQVLSAGTYTISAIASTVFRIGIYPGNALPSYGTTASTVYEVYSNATPQSNYYTITLEQTSCVVLFIVNGAHDYDVEHSADILAHIQYELGSTATEYAPYSNICPISGWTEAKITCAAKNLIDASNAALYDVDGQGLMRNATQPFFLAPGTYTISQSGNTEFKFVNVTDNYSTSGAIKSTTPRIITIIKPSVCVVRSTSGITNTTQFINNNLQVELGESATAYESYVGTTSTVSWQSTAGTVYGGTLTDNGDGTWTLKVTHQIVVLDGSESDWQLSRPGAAHNCFSLAIADAYCPNRVYVQCVSSHFNSPPSLPAEDERENTIFFDKFGRDIELPPYLNIGASSDIGQTVEDFKTWLASNNVMVVYHLATPQTYTLTAESVLALIGQNNIFADCGNIEVTYDSIYKGKSEIYNLVHTFTDVDEWNAEYQTNTITNVPVASFTDGTDGIPVKSLTVNIDPMQSGSGDPSPSNVRPITGRTGARITNRGGSNILPLTLAKLQNDNTDGTWDNNVYTRRGVSFTVNVDSSGFVESITTSGQQTDNTAFGLYITIPAGRYYLSGCPSGGSVSFSYSVRIRDLETENQIIDTGSGIEFSYDSPTDVYVYIVYNRSFAGSVGQIFTPSIVSDSVQQIPWQSEAGTVYSGTLTDNGDGTWTLVKTMVGVDMGTMTWGASSQSGCFYTNPITGYKKVNNMVFYCSEYKPDGHGSTGDLYGANNTIRYFLSESTGSAFNVHDDAQAGKTGEQFASAVSGVMLVYELATPAAPITLTVDSVKTLLGNNNIFADCGNISSLTYSTNVNTVYRSNIIADKVKKPQSTSQPANILSEILPTVSQNDIETFNVDEGIAIEDTGDIIVINNSNGLIDILEDTKLAYELQTSEKYIVPITSIKTVDGINNIWSEVSDIEVTYQSNKPTEEGLFLGQYQGTDSFNDFIESLSITPIQGNIILYNNDEYIYQNNSWNKIVFFGTVMNTSQYVNPNPGEIVFSVNDEKYYLYDGNIWSENMIAIYVFLKYVRSEGTQNA